MKKLSQKFNPTCECEHSQCEPAISFDGRFQQKRGEVYTEIKYENIKKCEEPTKRAINQQIVDTRRNIKGLE